VEIRVLYCAQCGRSFRVPTIFYDRVYPDYHCDACSSFIDTLHHPHSLSVKVDSLEELNRIASRLLQIATPDTYSYNSRHYCFSRAELEGQEYWLCYWYNRISLEFIEVLSTLYIRYTLHDTVEHKDSLRFWPGYHAPEGTLSFLVLNRQANDR